MSKRRKRRRLAFITRMREIARENPNLALEQVKTQTAIEVKNALREADRTAPHSREEHHKVFEDTLFSKNKATSTTTTKAEAKTTTTKAKPKTTTTKAKPKTTTKTKAKPKTATKSKTTTATKAKKSASSTTAKKRTTAKRTKKVNLPKDTLVG